MSYHGTTSTSGSNNRQGSRPATPPSTPSINNTSDGYSELPVSRERQTLENLYTDGKEFVTPDGNPYVGPYHIHPRKGPMVGAKHVSTPHALLTPVETDSNDPKGPSNNVSLSDRDFSLQVRAEEIVSVSGENTVSIDVCDLVYPAQAVPTNGIIGLVNFSVRDLSEKLEVTPTEPIEVKNYSRLTVKDDSGPGDPPPPFVPCTLDVDGDGYVTQSDIERIYDFSQPISIRFDIDGDGTVTTDDLALARQYIGTFGCGSDSSVSIEDALVKDGCFFRVTPKSYTPDTAIFSSTNWDAGSSTNDGVDFYTAEGYIFPLRNLAFNFHPILKELGEEFYQDTRPTFRGRALDSYNEKSGFSLLNNTDVLGSNYDPVALGTTNFPESSLYFHLGSGGRDQTMLKRRYFDSFYCFTLGGGNSGSPELQPPRFQNHTGPTSQEPGKMGSSTSMTLEFFFKPQRAIPATNKTMYTVPLHGTGVYPMRIRENANGTFQFRWRLPIQDYPTPGYRGANDQEDINGVSYQEFLDSDFTIPFDIASAMPTAGAYVNDANNLYITDDQTSQGQSLIEFDSWNYLAITLTGQTISVNANGISVSKSIGDKRFDGNCYDQLDPYPDPHPSGDSILMTQSPSSGMGMTFPYVNNDTRMLPPDGGPSSCELHSVSIYNRVLSVPEITNNRLALEALNLQ